MRRFTAPVIASLSVLGLLAGSPPARADTIALTFRSNAYQPSFNVIGWEFTVNSPLTVTQLGWFDFGSDGLLTAHTVGIFNSSGTLLVSTVLGPGTTDPFDGPPVTTTFGVETGRYRYTPVAPTSLEAGQNYVLAGTQFGSSDNYPVAVPLSEVQTDPSLSFVQGRLSFAPFTGLTFPGPDPVPNGRNFGPNFQFETGPTVIPEPTSFALLALGTLSLLGYGWRRRLQPAACTMQGTGPGEDRQGRSG